MAIIKFKCQGSLCVTFAAPEYCEYIFPRLPKHARTFLSTMRPLTKQRSTAYSVFNTSLSNNRRKKQMFPYLPRNQTIASRANIAEFTRSYAAAACKSGKIAKNFALKYAQQYNGAQQGIES